MATSQNNDQTTRQHLPGWTWPLHQYEQSNNEKDYETPLVAIQAGLEWEWLVPILFRFGEESSSPSPWIGSRHSQPPHCSHPQLFPSFRCSTLLLPRSPTHQAFTSGSSGTTFGTMKIKSLVANIQAKNYVFPCGMYSLRARDKGFTPAQRQDLRDLECDINLELKAMSRLLDSYLHHRAANAQQKPVLKRLVDQPSPSTVTLLCDFKELMTLPILGKTPGEAFYATARMEISCFGCVLSQGLAATADAPQRVRKAYLLIFSDTLDHTCTRANHCIDISLQTLGEAGKNLSELNIVSDAAGHFRGFESLYHHLVCLPQRHKCIVRNTFRVREAHEGRSRRIIWLGGAGA